MDPKFVSRNIFLRVRSVHQVVCWVFLPWGPNRCQIKEISNNSSPYPLSWFLSWVLLLQCLGVLDFALYLQLITKSYSFCFLSVWHIWSSSICLQILAVIYIPFILPCIVITFLLFFAIAKQPLDCSSAKLLVWLIYLRPRSSYVTLQCELLYWLSGTNRVMWVFLIRHLWLSLIWPCLWTFYCPTTLFSYSSAYTILLTLTYFCLWCFRRKNSLSLDNLTYLRFSSSLGILLKLC